MADHSCLECVIGGGRKGRDAGDHFPFDLVAKCLFVQSASLRKKGFLGSLSRGSKMLESRIRLLHNNKALANCQCQRKMDGHLSRREDTKKATFLERDRERERESNKNNGLL